MPILSPHSLEIISRSPEQTRRVGMRLGGLLQPGDVVCLAGDLGSGKTTLMQGIASGWGSLDQVTSPTFVLVNMYRRPGRQQLFHLDAYRLSGALEAMELDINSMLENGPLIVEWADRIRSALPAENLWAALNWVDESQRDILFSGRGNRFQFLIDILRKHMYGG